MKILNLVQGSPEWLAHRLTTHNASDAPAMMGVSPYVSRADLVRQRATGIAREIDAATQAVFDKGHAIEPVLRALAENIIGEDLYPITATSDDGYLGASFDGVTLDESIIFEAKQPNATKQACIERGEIPPMDHWQIVQQFAVNERAEKCLYMCGDGTDEGTPRLWIERARIETDILKQRAGWVQFDADVAAYKPESVAAPEAVGRAPDQLPALHIELTGMVTASNLGQFKSHAMAVLGGINRNLKTDDDFADAEKTVKWCSDVESRIAAAKQHALSQTASIDELFRTLDDVSAETRRIRLELDKLVKAEKDSRKSEIVAAGVDAVRAHYATVNASLGEHAIVPPPSLSTDIGGAIKGLRTLTSIKDAVDAAIASAKIAANQRADMVRANVAALKDASAGYETLFADRVALCTTKAPDDIRNLAAARIAEHQKREEAKRIEAERLTELAKAQVAATTKASQGNDASAAAEPPPPTPSPSGVVPPRVAGAAPMPAGARIKLGDINAAIAPLTITADGLALLGFKSVGTERAAKLYDASEFPAVCDALIAKISAASQRSIVRAAAA